MGPDAPPQERGTTLQVPAGEQRDLDVGGARVRVANHSAREAAAIPGSPTRAPVTVTAFGQASGSPRAFPDNVEVHLELEQSEGGDANPEGDVQVALKMQEFTNHMNKAYVEDITDLQRQLREKDAALARLAASKDGRIRELLLSNEALQRARYMVPGDDLGEGTWLDRLIRSYRRSKVCWWISIILALLLLLFIILLGSLVPQARQRAIASSVRNCSSSLVDSSSGGSTGPAPSFLYPPQLAAAGNSSLDVQVAVNPAALVYYVLLPGSAASRHLLQLPSVENVLATAGGTLGSTLASAVACGVAPVPRPGINTTISISSQSNPTTECTVAAVAGVPLCNRCPRLLPDTTYQLLMVAATGASRSQLQSVPVSTGGTWASTTPQLRQGASLLPPRAAALSSGAGTFGVGFALTGPGSVRFLVSYTLLYARFGNTFTSFGNQPMTDARAVSGATRAQFSNGLVATGVISKAAADTPYSCTVEVMGLSGTGSGCACTPAATCTVDASCFGDLCLYSRYAVLPQTTYTVTLVPTSADGGDRGNPVMLPPFQTPAATSAPWPSKDMSAGSAVTPNSFVVNGIQQDRPGLMYVIAARLTDPNAQAIVPAGSATVFKQGANRRLRRLLQAASAKVLAPTTGVDSAGDMFDPPCTGQLPCETNATVQAWLNPVRETLVYASCIPVNTIASASSTQVSNLADDTVYHVMAIPTDLAGNQAAWSAYVRTKDTTPPELTLEDVPTPALTNFSVVVSLNEAGTIYGAVMFTSKADTVTAAPTCPPSWQGSTLMIFRTNVTTGGVNITLGPFVVPQENTNYTVRLIAEDVYTNCQPEFTRLTVATADRNPPVFLALGATNVTGNSSVLVFGLNKRGSISYQVAATDASPCPTPTQLFALQPATGYAQVPSWVGTTLVGYTLGSTQQLTGLDSQTNYTLCAIAQDAPPFNRQQVTVSSTTFLTLDMTPPVLRAVVVPGTDGDVSCSRTDYLCNGTFSITLDEPGAVRWVVLDGANPLPAQLPTPQAIFTSTNLTSLFPGHQAGASGTGSGNNVTGVARLLPSQANYVLLVTGRDNPPNQAPNYITTVVTVNFTAPDVTPPVFQGVGLVDANDTSFTANATLNEASSVAYVVLEDPSDMPTPEEVVAGTGSNGTAVAVNGTSAGFQMGVPRTFPLDALLPGTMYDVYLVATDAAGNRQTRVTNITAVRTPDTRPPLILDLSATFTPPMNLTVTVTTNKPGKLLLAARAAAASALSQQQVMDAVATSSSTLANFTDSFVIPAANVATSSMACVADGQLFVVYAVAQDREGAWPPYVPNNSSVSSAPVTLLPAPAQGSCLPEQFLAPLAPLLSFTTAGSGLAYGPITINTSSAAGTVWRQAVGAFSRQPRSQPVGVVSRLGNLVLPTPVSLTVTALPPAAVSALVRSYVLVPEDNSDMGATLRASFQLTDGVGRTQVDASNIRVRPLLTYSEDALPPGITTVANNALADCDLDGTLDDVSGVGECEVLLGEKFFPAAGAVTVNMTLQVLNGSTALAVSDPVPLVLSAPPSPPPYTASSPGVIMTLPYRPVYFGETITLTIVAANPTSTPLSRFSVPLRWNSNVLTYVSASAGPLWSAIQTADPPLGQVPLGSFNGKILSVGGRADGADVSQYRTSSSIPLLEVTFTVRQAVANVYAGVVSLGRSPSLWPNGPPLTLDPGFASVSVQAADFRGSGAAAGDLNVTSIALAGVWAWAGAYDLYNTPALSGGTVSTSLHATTVSTFGPEDDSIQSCSLAAGGGAVSGVLTVTPPSGGVCSAVVGGLNTQPDPGVNISVALRGFSQHVALSVWYPQNVTLRVADPTLNAVLPLNANLQQLSPGCTDRYQVSRMSVSADWTNGGGGLFPGADVTQFVAFASNDSSVAMVLGSTVKGVSPGAARISLVGMPAATALVRVTRQPVCLLSLTALATTGIKLAPGAAGAGASGVPYVPPNPLVTSTATWSWQAAQDLTWEAASALVLTYATFSDGTTMDVTARSSLGISAAALAAAAAAGNSSGVAPFYLGTNNALSLPTVVVNATVGAPPSCSPSLVTTWSTCSLQLASGTGTVRVRLPSPNTIVNFTATPAGTPAGAAANLDVGKTPVITSTGDSAAMQPLGLPTSAALSVFVSFSDGTVRDFSTDPRTSIAVTAGAALCAVNNATGGRWQVVSPSARLSGTCTLTVSITFNGTAQPLTATTSVAVVVLSALQLYRQGPNTIALPGLTPDDLGQPLGANLTLLKCDGRNFDQLTVWTMGMLSNCTNSTCTLADLNRRLYTNLTSSSNATARLMTGYPSNPAAATYPDMDNRLVPYAAGTTTLAAAFGTTTTSVAVAVKETYAPRWPGGVVVNDTALTISANMTEAYDLLMRAIPSAQLDLVANPPAPADVIKSGLSLLPDAAQGPFYYSATAGPLVPGTNYSVLLAVRAGLVVSPGVTAVTGLLVPDNNPPSFTSTLLTGAASDPALSTFTIRMTIGIDEPGGVFYAVYGNPQCITAAPTVLEVQTAVNLVDVGKCNCTYTWCAAVSSGRLALASGNASAAQLTGPVPTSPYTALASQPRMQCNNRSDPANPFPPRPASSRKAVFLAAEDDMPTFKGWTSTCAAPLVDQTTPPSPCAPVTITACNNTRNPAIPDVPNLQLGPWHNVSRLFSNSDPPPPQHAPVSGNVDAPDPYGIAFTTAVVSATTSNTVVFRNKLNKPGLVLYRLVQNVVEELAWGYRPVLDASVTNTEVISRDCATQSPLVPGVVYGLWYWAVDNYGKPNQLALVNVTIPEP